MISYDRHFSSVAAVISLSLAHPPKPKGTSASWLLCTTCHPDFSTISFTYWQFRLRNHMLFFSYLQSASSALKHLEEKVFPFVFSHLTPSLPGSCSVWELRLDQGGDAVIWSVPVGTFHPQIGPSDDSSLK